MKTYINYKKRVFDRAKQANSPKKVFMKLIDLYRKDNKWEHVEELSKVLQISFLI